MFNKKLKTDSYTNLIANGTIVEGKITFEGTLKVQGGINGDIARKTSENKECLIVDKTGVISAQEINVFDSVINGTVSCKTLWVENTLRVSSEAQIIADAEKGSPRDPLRETALRDIESLRDSLTQGTEKFFQFALYVTLYTDTLEENE